MPEPIPVSLSNAVVKQQMVDDLKQLIQHQFARRSLAHAELWDRLRYGADIVAYLRRHSEVYREISTEKEGPLLFSLGYLRLNDRELECTSNALPEPNVEALCKVLSEFLEPGAVIRLGSGDNERVVKIEEKGRLERLAE